MQNRIPVLSSDGYPLVPCRPERARQLVQQGKAVSRWRQGIYHIKLTNRTRADCVVPHPYELNILPGADSSGYAITLTYSTGHRIPAAIYERDHDGKAISRRLARRANYRRSRRYRLPYRKPTGHNRHKPKGWLAPSQEHQLEQHKRLIDALTALYPIGLIRIQVSRFDTTLMQNPHISAEEYQQGTLYGWHLREYIRYRDQYRCVYCDATNTRLELDHIIPLAHGGPTRPGNLVCSCRNCNQQKADQTLEQFLAHDPARAARIRKQAKGQRFQAATQMNILTPRIVAHAAQTGLPIRRTTGVTTAWQRRRLGIDKSKSYDAIVLEKDFTTLGILPELCAAIRNSPKPDKQKVQTDRNGTPVGQAYRNYQRQTKRQQSKIATPGHAGRSKRHGPQGISTGDIILLEHHKLGKVKGIAVPLPSNGGIRLRGTKPNVTSRLRNATLLQRRPAVVSTYRIPSASIPQRPR